MNALFQHDDSGLRHNLQADDSLLVPANIITTLESLQTHLQWAIELEHSTIPPYLCALYSIHDGTNTYASKTIRSVVMEEMLHMILGANILNAIKGSPNLTAHKLIVEYPTPLPHSDGAFLVNLEGFSKDALDTFLKIEKPAKPLAPPDDNKYHTIGQFYHAIKLGLVYVNELHKKEGGIFKGDPSFQIGAEQYYGGGGQITPIYNLHDALLAIDEIVGQGEGIHHDIQDPDHVLFGEEIEYAHYFKFNEIRCERLYQPTDDPALGPTGPFVDVDWSAVYPMQRNVKMEQFKRNTPVYHAMREFNLTYMSLLDCLNTACNGVPAALMEKGIPLMYDLKYKAQALMKIPIQKGLTVGPSFEYVKT